MSMLQTLREAIDRWLSAKKVRSLTSLSKLSKVSYSTIRRIMQGETENPDSQNVLALAGIVMSKPEVLAFARQHFPLLAEDRELSVKAEEDELLELMDDPEHIPLLILASHSKGTTEEEVTFYYGNELAQRFKNLIDSGLLTRGEGESWRLDKEVGASNLSVARKWISVMSSIARSQNDQINKAAISHIAFESVNFETALAMYHAGMDYVRKIMSLTQDKNNRGDILVMTGTLFNVLKGVEAYK